jgi:chromosomal replication initiator protein
LHIIWENSLKIIKEKVSQQNFETWIRPIKIVSMEGTHIHLSVPNKFFKDWLAENYHPIIKNSIASLVGTDIKVDFLISQDKDETHMAAPKSEYPHNMQKTKSKSTRSRTHQSLNPHYNLLMRHRYPWQNSRLRITILFLFMAASVLVKPIY